MEATDWIAVINGMLLLVLAVRAFWGWVFKREYSEGDLSRDLKKLEGRLDAETTERRRLLEIETKERRDRDHDISKETTRVLLQLGVHENRLDHLEERVDRLEQWRRT